MGICFLRGLYFGFWGGFVVLAYIIQGKGIGTTAKNFLSEYVAAPPESSASLAREIQLLGTFSYTTTVRTVQTL